MSTYRHIYVQRDTYDNLALHKRITESWDSFLNKLVSQGIAKVIPRYDGNWNELVNYFDSTEDRPIEIIGTPGAGKSYTMKQVINKAKDKIFFVIDSANEYDFLPTVSDASANNLKANCRMVPNKVPDIARIELQFQVINKLVEANGSLPKNLIVVLEEAGRYVSLNWFGNESRKFCKTILISPNKLWGADDTLECVKMLRDRIEPTRHKRKKLEPERSSI